MIKCAEKDKYPPFRLVGPVLKSAFALFLGQSLETSIGNVRDYIIIVGDRVIVQFQSAALSSEDCMEIDPHLADMRTKR